MAAVDLTWLDSELQRTCGPHDAWEGQCFGLACAVVEVLPKSAGAVAVYGHWVGPVDELHPVWGEQAHIGFVRHGWVVMPDGRVIDPTRWSFNSAAPYIYHGPSDHYDEGGNALRATLRTPFRTPFPQRVPQGFPPAASTRHQLVLPLLDAAKLIKQLTGRSYKLGKDPGTFVFVFNTIQLLWIANAPYDVLRPYNRIVYEVLAARVGAAAVPSDNFRKAKRGT